jgi:hypothetical protein
MRAGEQSHDLKAGSYFATKAFVEDQLWYAPRQDFSLSDLSQTQKQSLKNLTPE